MATIARATVYAVLALIWVTPVGAQLATPEAAIRAQVQGFYRDDRNNRWPDVLDHFWVGKITARWARVFITRCGGGTPDELWMLRVGEDWRIARMIRGS